MSCLHLVCCKSGDFWFNQKKIYFFILKSVKYLIHPSQVSAGYYTSWSKSRAEKLCVCEKGIFSISNFVNRGRNSGHLPNPKIEIFSETIMLFPAGGPLSCCPEAHSRWPEYFRYTHRAKIKEQKSGSDEWAGGNPQLIRYSKCGK